MSYTRYEWDCGDIITARRMNNIEDGIEEAMSSGGDAGFECEYSQVQTFISSRSLATTDFYGYNRAMLPKYVFQPIIDVTFDGVLYSHLVQSFNGSYGGVVDLANLTVDFKGFPFIIYRNNLITQVAGSHTIKIDVYLIQSVEVTPCFLAALKESSKKFEKTNYDVWTPCFGRTSSQPITIPAHGKNLELIEYTTAEGVAWDHTSLLDVLTRIEVFPPTGLIVSEWVIERSPNNDAIFVGVVFYNTSDTDVVVSSNATVPGMLINIDSLYFRPFEEWNV